VPGYVELLVDEIVLLCSHVAEPDVSCEGRPFKADAVHGMFAGRWGARRISSFLIHEE
jgi:hypothetical protein